MADTPESLLSEVFARQALLVQLVRLLLRERAAEKGQTEHDIMQWAEETKLFFERNVTSGLVEDYLTGAVDTFFNVLASEVKADAAKRKKRK